jgi:RNA polymerase sigma factor (sigma-70 family)
MTLNLEHQVRLAKEGHKQALEAVVDHIRDRIYGLALRMLGNPEDAEDQSQEILIKIITHLSDYREESAFGSWVYRIACNHLLTTRKQASARQAVSFEFLEEMFASESDKPYTLSVSGPERDLLLEETRLECMQTVPACLDGSMRIVFILGDVFGVTSKEGAYIREITPDGFSSTPFPRQEVHPGV